jgi:hypothetical protein
MSLTCSGHSGNFERRRTKIATVEKVIRIFRHFLREGISKIGKRDPMMLSRRLRGGGV